MLITKSDLRNFKRGIKHVHSSIIILKDAIENNNGMLEYEDIKDNIDFILSKINDLVELYKKLSMFICETEECMQVDLMLFDIRSLLKVLKYSLKARRTKVTIDDIYNCLNILSKNTTIIVKYSYHIIFEFENINNVLPIYAIDFSKPNS